VLINKVESAAEFERAREVARSVIQTSRIGRVAIGALRKDVAAGWEVWTR
jgi:hypothetical protein